MKIKNFSKLIMISLSLSVFLSNCGDNEESPAPVVPIQPKGIEPTAAPIVEDPNQKEIERLKVEFFNSVQLNSAELVLIKGRINNEINLTDPLTLAKKAIDLRKEATALKLNVDPKISSDPGVQASNVTVSDEIIEIEKLIDLAVNNKNNGFTADQQAIIKKEIAEKKKIEAACEVIKSKKMEIQASIDAMDNSVQAVALSLQITNFFKDNNGDEAEVLAAKEAARDGLNISLLAIVKKLKKEEGNKKKKADELVEKKKKVREGIKVKKNALKARFNDNVVITGDITTLFNDIDVIIGNISSTADDGEERKNEADIIFNNIDGRIKLLEQAAKDKIEKENELLNNLDFKIGGSELEVKDYLNKAHVVYGVSNEQKDSFDKFIKSIFTNDIEGQKNKDKFDRVKDSNAVKDTIRDSDRGRVGELFKFEDILFDAILNDPDKENLLKSILSKPRKDIEGFKNLTFEDLKIALTPKKVKKKK